MSEIYQGTIVATVWVDAGDVGVPTYRVNPILLPPGKWILVWNLVPLGLGGAPGKPLLELRRDRGINRASGDSRLRDWRVLSPAPDEPEWNNRTQWVVEVEHQATEAGILHYNINSDEDPTTHDPMILVTTDPVIPPP